MREGAHIRTGASWWHRAAALAMFALFLMPVSYRAGAATPHGHALIQLIYEASEGIPVHYHGVDQMDRHQGTGDIATSHAGAPPIQVMASSALLPMILLAMLLQTLRTSRRPASDARPAGCSLRPEHPPPRHHHPV